MKHNLEKDLKRWLKRKVSISLATIVVFAITGSVGLAENITKFSDITAEKTEQFGSMTMTELEKNLKAIDTSVNKNLGYKKIAVLGIWSKVKDYKTEVIGGLPGLMQLAGNSAKQEAVVKSRIKEAVKKQVEEIYGKNFEAKETFKKDLKEAEGLPQKSHTAIADLSNYLPKVLKKADEVVDKVNSHSTKIERLEDEKASYKFVDSAISAEKAALDKEKEERKAADKALEKSLIDTYNGLNNRLLTEVDTRAKEDAKLATKIKKEENARKLKDDEHDKDIAANKDAIQTEIAERTKAVLAEENARKKADEALQAALDAEIERSEAKDKEHDEGIAANKKAIEYEVARSTAEDLKHTKDIAENTESIKKGLNFAGNHGTTNKQLGDTMSIKGKEGVSEEDVQSKYDTENVVTTVDKDGNLWIKLAKNPKFNSVEAGDGETKVTIGNDGVKIGDKTYITKDGLDANKQKIVNVADGIIAKDSKDAVNGGQIHNIVQDINNSIHQTNHRIDKLDDKVNRGLANAAAMAGIEFLDIGINQGTVAAAVGGYKGTNAVAVGVQGAPTENTRVNAKVSVAPGTHTEMMYSVGAAYRFNWK
ncbi:YadA-like family protein [Fusobacterium necrophorum]|uniref:YadA-like family protein n=1 Tax=Fusobacterium necrophorum TaxID=859 RepID=UPI000A57B924|nr:YadA-like family protein [Fusobacterium necrophorum]